MSKLEVLSDSECVKLLRAHALGRLAMTDHNGRPEIFPINYFFDEGLVVFRTDPGTKLDLSPGRRSLLRSTVGMPKPRLPGA